MPNPGDKVKILTTLQGYVDFFEAEKAFTSHTHGGTPVSIAPGDYYYFGASAGVPKIWNISKTQGKTGWWIDSTLNKEPEKYKVLTTLKGYVSYTDAERAFGDEHTHGPNNSVDVLPGDYYLFGRSAGKNNIANVSR